MTSPTSSKNIYILSCVSYRPSDTWLNALYSCLHFNVSKTTCIIICGWVLVLCCIRNGALFEMEPMGPIPYGSRLKVLRYNRMLFYMLVSNRLTYIGVCLCLWGLSFPTLPPQTPPWRPLQLGPRHWLELKTHHR